MNIIARTDVGLPAVVTNSEGGKRSPLATGLDVVTGHYTGSPHRLRDKSPRQALVELQANAVALKKPFEYNYVITQDGSLVEYAGLFMAAHSEGDNATSIGVQFYNGVGEPLTDAQVAAFVFVRRHLVQIGALTPQHRVVRHRDMPGAATPCPGDAVEARWSECTAPLTEAGARGDDDIVGASRVTLAQARAWAFAQGVPADILPEIPGLYWELAPPLGLRPEVAFAQAMVETARFAFPRCGITVCTDFCNPCGMRTTVITPGPNGEAETPQNHQRFPSWRVGAQAHLDHLALYVGRPGYPRANDQTPDPRHFPFLLGKVDSLTHLGDFWVTGGVRPVPSYGASIRARIAEMAAMPGGNGNDDIDDDPEQSEEDFDMATTAELESVVRKVLDEATGFGLTDFDGTVNEILELGRNNHNDLQALKAELAALRTQIPALG